MSAPEKHGGEDEDEQPYERACEACDETCASGGGRGGGWDEGGWEGGGELEKRKGVSWEIGVRRIDY